MIPTHYLTSFVHWFIVLLIALVLLRSWIRVVIVSISVVLRLVVAYVCPLISSCVVEAGSDFIPVYPL